MGVGLLGFGLWMLNNGLHSTRLTLDRESHTVTLSRPYRLGRHTQAFSIFAVSGLIVTHNHDLNIFALMLVLRSGERYALATVNPFAEEALRALATRVRHFLNHPYPPIAD